jgi:nitrogen regulatory protein PII
MNKKIIKKENLDLKDSEQFELILAIVGRGFADYVVSSAREAGATGATILYGRGTSDSDKHVMGISLQPEREVILILVKKSERRKVMQEIAEKTSLLEEGRGLCFSVPVSNVYGLKRVEEQMKEQIKKAKEFEKQFKAEARASKKSTKVISRNNTNSAKKDK